MDATQTTVVASSEFKISHDALFPVRLRIYGINYCNTVTMAHPRVTTVMVRPQSTMGDVLGFLREHLSGCIRDLHVVLHDQTLPREATFDQLRLPHGIELQVTPHPKSWDLVFQIASAAVRTLEAPSAFTRFIPNDRVEMVGRYLGHAADDIVPLVRNFLHNASTFYPTQPPNHPEIIAEYLSVLSCSGIIKFLVECYFSKFGPYHTRAHMALRCLLWPHTLLTETPSKIVEVWTAPLCVEVCRLIASSPEGGKNDVLYKYSRLRLAAVCNILGKKLCPHNLPTLPRDWLIKELSPFAQEKANEAITCITEGRTLSDVDSFEFNNLFDVLCSAVHPLRVGSFPSFLAREWRQIEALSETAMCLLNAVSEFMARLARDLPPMGPWSKRQLPNWVSEGLVNNIWDVLTMLYTWAKMDNQVSSAMRATLMMHRSSLNVLVLTHTNICLQESLSIRWILFQYRVVLGFEARRHLAMSMLPEMEESMGVTRSQHIPKPEPLKMRIDRPRLLSISFSYIMEATRHELQSGLKIEFLNEDAVGRGVRKEWLTLVSHALFNQQRALFSPCPHERRKFFLNPAPTADPLHLQYFNVAGRIIGLALAHKVQVGICFDRTLFLQLAGQPVTLDDIADADPALLASCKKILDMDPDAVASLGLTFAREVVQVSRCRKVIDLLPGGRDIAVDGTNRCQYVDLLIQDLFVTRTHDELASFEKGFALMLFESGRHQEFFQGLDLDDFNRMLGGTMDPLDVEEWRSRTVLRGYNEEDDQIKWFWTTVEGMTEEQRRRLLYFWTSGECLPFGGFHELLPLITRAAHATSDHLPSSNTCNNNLNLPCYTSLSMTQSRLTFIVQEHIFTGFGLS